MKNTGIVVLIATFIFTTALQIALADESIVEKVSASSRDAKRGLKKGANRAKEAFCMDGDLECSARKAKNRLNEAGEVAVDAATKLKNKID
jgi:uncharacterized low-complexity protein